MLLFLPSISQMFEATLALTDNCFFFRMTNRPPALGGPSTPFSSLSHLTSSSRIILEIQEIPSRISIIVWSINHLLHLHYTFSYEHIMGKMSKLWLNVCSVHGLILMRFSRALQLNYPYMECGPGEIKLSNPFLVNYSNGPVINWQIQFAEL